MSKLIHAKRLAQARKDIAQLKAGKVKPASSEALAMVIQYKPIL